MPTYEYRCEAGHEFEKVQSINDEPLTQCEIVFMGISGNFSTGETYERPTGKCTAKVERLISKSTFVLKGGGWTGKTYA